MRGERRNVLQDKYRISKSATIIWKGRFDSDDSRERERDTYFMPLELPHVSQ